MSYGGMIFLRSLKYMHRDFNAPDDADRPADSSAAMIAASAFLLLAQIEQLQSPANTSGSEYWLESAMQVSESFTMVWLILMHPQLLRNTTASYWEPDWQSLLSNGTVNNVDNPPVNNTGIIYGTYTNVYIADLFFRLSLS